jgi:hypothetical protein
MTAYGPLALIARDKRSRAVILAAGLAVAACAGAKPSLMTAFVSPSPTPPVMSAPPLMPPPESTAQPVEIMPREMAPPPAPAPEPPPPPPPPVDGPGLRAAYGAPDFIRREDESELWRYDVAGCAVFFFLYREGEALKIRYAESNPRGKEAPIDPTCLNRLNDRGAAPVSRKMS